MRIELIENRGPNTLLSAFRGLLGKAALLDAQVAFVSAEGVGSVLPYLQKVAAQGKVRIITGLYQGITEPSALRLLLTAQRQTKGRLETRLARNLRFHRKLYFTRTGNTCCVISGSSNLSSEGLKSAGEFNLLVRLPESNPQIRRLLSEFERLWETDTVPLSSDYIKCYERLRPKRQRAKFSAPALSRVLGSGSSNGAEPDASGLAPRYWRDWISGFVKQRTQTIVHDETDWDRKGYDWCTSGSTVFERGDRILLFNETTSWAQVVVVKDTTRTAIPTPDGRHFVAYQSVRNYSRRRLNRKLWKSLADVGMAIPAANRTSPRRLSQGQWGRVMSIFQK